MHQQLKKLAALQADIKDTNHRLSLIEDQLCPSCLADTDSPLFKADLSEREIKSIRRARAARYNELLAAYDAAAANGMTHKIWRTQGGDSVRASHTSANNQKVDIKESFRVGSTLLFLPSDPAAPFTETANCRCDVKYVREENPKEMANPFRRYPTSGDVAPEVFKLRGTRTYKFVAGSKVLVTIYAVNPLPTQVSGYRIRAFAAPRAADGSEKPIIYNPESNSLNRGDYVTPLYPETEPFDLRYINPYGFNWHIIASPATARSC